MRLASLALIGLVVTTTPVLAKSAPQGTEAKASCSVKLENVAGASGYKMVRHCAKLSERKDGEVLAIARQPVVDGSNIASGAGGVLVSLFALGAVVGGIFAAADSDDRVLPDDDDGGLDPASP